MAGKNGQCNARNFSAVKQKKILTRKRLSTEIINNSKYDVGGGVLIGYQPRNKIGKASLIFSLNCSVIFALILQGNVDNFSPRSIPTPVIVDKVLELIQTQGR